MADTATHHPTREEVANYTDRVGQVFVSGDLPESWGRVAGYLMVCDPEAQTAVQISQGTRLSTEEVGGILCAFAGARAIQQNGEPGGADTTFQMPPRAHWEELFRTRARMVAELRDLTGEELDLVNDREGRGPGRRLRDVHDLYSRVAEGLGKAREAGSRVPRQ
ncbi:hypothetical protein [Marinitenerispora sediminis]|nr:hypothetical protein [Marinitenerispora sediminis]RCV54432.1 hypothetical protein DEF23_15930 [Marinitenerispora sediminis]RCV55342.1 hypothetical protein DEF28_06035 [Marinitenerispora sediminis]